jgi:hypothetical protein
MKQVTHLLRRVWHSEQLTPNYEGRVNTNQQDRSSMADLVRILQAHDQARSELPSGSSRRDVG